MDWIETSRGSTYKYLADWRTQRFKRTEGKILEPQDIIAFIPPFEVAMKHLRNPDYVLHNFGESEDYLQTMLTYVNAPAHRIYLQAKSGKVIWSNRELHASAEPAFAAFVNPVGETLHLPVAKMPVIGFHTFDSRVFFKAGERMPEWHIGNPVTRIEYKSQR